MTVWGEVVADPEVWGGASVCDGIKVTGWAPAAECKDAWLRLATCEAGMVKDSVAGVSESD